MSAAEEEIYFWWRPLSGEYENDWRPHSSAPRACVLVTVAVLATYEEQSWLQATRPRGRGYGGGRGGRRF
jgi:hypothetical protein